MSKHWITNYNDLALTPERKTVLDIAEVGLEAIETSAVINSQVHYQNGILAINNHTFNLNQYKNICVLGFGKASCKAAYALEQILGDRINNGIAIGLKTVACEYIKTYQGTHPQPSAVNVEISQEIMNMGKQLGEDDLVITIISGGGSALLCWPMDECKQSQKLYQAFLGTGGNVTELNTVRKHISKLKGGWLAKYLYPATVVGLIFSDVPGDDFSQVASGPTYKDTTTIADAQTIINKYNLGEYNLTETPKEDQYFHKVTNIPLLSNKTALEAMANFALSQGFQVKILSAEIYDDSDTVMHNLLSAIKNNTIILGAGEIKLLVDKPGGSGGRNLYLAMKAITHMGPKDTFASVASDGLDNSNSAGAIVDAETNTRVLATKLNLVESIAKFDGYNFFEALGSELIFTGPTEANVSDFMIFYRAS